MAYVAVVRGIDPNCGCFGGERAFAWHVVGGNTVNLVFLVILTMAAERFRTDRQRRNSDRQDTMRTSAREAVIGVFLLCLIFESIAFAKQRVKRSTSQPAPKNLVPGKKFIRTYSRLRDWRGRMMTYHVNLPPDFRMDRKYPIVFEWHGKGGGPQTYLFPGVYKLTGHIHVGLTYPLGCRHGTAMRYATKPYVKFMRYVYDDVVENFHGNPDYVFIGGFSAGGFMATGPGISLMTRAKLRDQLAGVVAGGCNWMCDPRYAKGRNIFLWYADNDPNSYELPKRLGRLRRYAKSLTVILHKGAGHRCDNNFEGPAIRKFFALNGPDKKDFEKLYEIEQHLENGHWRNTIKACHRIAEKHNTASPLAQKLLSRALDQMESHVRASVRTEGPDLAAIELLRLFSRYHDTQPVAARIKEIARSLNIPALTETTPP